MAKHGQQQQETSANDPASNSGGRQAVVELCDISACGLVFWSRHHFEIGAEVLVRIRRSALPANCHALTQTKTKWVMLKGLVVACPPQRRADGSSGFEVSLLMEQALCDCLQPPQIPAQMCWFTPPLPGLRRFGLN